jgi:hypothetical protein
MDNFEGNVVEYLRADRALFLNTQCCIQLNEADNPDTSGPHWYCDILVADHRDRAIFLCEVTFSGSLASLFKRLDDWNIYWPSLQVALCRDSYLPNDWPVRPWLFIPQHLVQKVITKLSQFDHNPERKRFLPEPRITTLEMVLPWKYRSWNRKGEEEKPPCIPHSMQV